MITYFIVDKLGSILYQSNRLISTTHDRSRIRYVSLFLMKDLIKAQLNETIQYIHIGNKTVVFKEEHNLLYIAWTKKSIPVSLLCQHLQVMQHYIRFHFGYQWNHKYTKPNDLFLCLKQLPFIHTKPIYSSDMLCACERVQINDDLRLRLEEQLIESCHSSFYIMNPHHKKLFSKNGSWAYSFLFAREKMVAQCQNSDKHPLPDEFVYFLRIMVSHYLKEKREKSHLKNTALPITPTASLSQDISTHSSPTTHTFTSSSSSGSEPFLAYEFDTSTSAPFKIKRKSNSSVTVVSEPSISYWNPQVTHGVHLSSSVPTPTTFLKEDDDSLKHRLRNLICGESYMDQADDVKLMRRWIEVKGHVYLANIILVAISDEVCSIVVCKDDPDKSWKPKSSQVKQFKTRLRIALSDFQSYLLTKETTHFTHLSFAVNYPGLVHFIHLKNGILVSPAMVDMNELDDHHELLHTIYSHYGHTETWTWPTLKHLKQLVLFLSFYLSTTHSLPSFHTQCQDMIKICLSQSNSKSIHESNHYTFLYEQHHHSELMAIYFNRIPIDRLWSMHQHLFIEIQQRF
ncbi:hypothetical protein BDB01DRAFT_390655 [Pilobolus umbonatus]|nr:hypothetical protein BDB01DRAFT_390655 [Pilobolus umbonatus]